MPGAVASVVSAAIMVLLLVQAGQAEEAEYELLRSYEAGDDVNGVSISSDGSYIAAGFDGEKIIAVKNRQFA